MNFLFGLLAVPVMFVAQAGVMPEVFSEANMVQFYNNGVEFSISESDGARFDEIFVDAISGSRQMPAFAVAIHKLTMQDFKEGYWVKFDYGKTVSASGMDFDQLLIHIQPNCYGVNVIRGNNGKFDGRCYYLDLDNTLDEVYDFLTTVDHVEKEKIEVEIEKGEESEVEIKESEDESEPKPDEDLSGNGKDDSTPDEKIEESSATTEIKKDIKENKKEKERPTKPKAENIKTNQTSDEQTEKIEESESQVLANESKIPSVNDERKEENKVIKQEPVENFGVQTEIKETLHETKLAQTTPEQDKETNKDLEAIESNELDETEKVTASSKLVEAVSQWGF